ncbi:hypothetical protein [Natranaerofaba carboxydovora]|uniref:hypothetical protein n=1 Tax=Natranaerofaba carboxydovora TaxID=2742683 RepID=UPI001F142DA6|nr:hypothetical protein [Natranaerofaba carboxydovora]UMZ72619.1 hypothetical protein ACONDI_00143 [Natranaerofaba carboxydovora]
MNKIKDRLIAGALSGIAANVVKIGIEHASKTFGYTEETGMDKAAGFFLSPSKVMTPKGKLIGFIGDTTIAGALGVFASYLMTITGKDYYALKGLTIGNMSWSTMYGVMASLGSTTTKSDEPNTYLTSLISHTAFGITKAYILVNIADSGIFKPHYQALGKPKEESDSASVKSSNNS